MIVEYKDTNKTQRLYFAEIKNEKVLFLFAQTKLLPYICTNKT